jgi:hypothetical protein
MAFKRFLQRMCQSLVACHGTADPGKIATHGPFTFQAGAAVHGVNVSCIHLCPYTAAQAAARAMQQVKT